MKKSIIEFENKDELMTALNAESMKIALCEILNYLQRADRKIYDTTLGIIKESNCFDELNR